MVLLCSSHVEPKKSNSDLKCLNNEFKVKVVPMTEKDVELLKNQNINFSDLEVNNLNKYVSTDKKK
jgi:riboflavin synthase alpha subunit